MQWKVLCALRRTLGGSKDFHPCFVSWWYISGEGNVHPVIKCFGNNSLLSRYRDILSVSWWAFHSSEMMRSLIAFFLPVTPLALGVSLKNACRYLLPRLFLNSCFQQHCSFSRPVFSYQNCVLRTFFFFLRILKAVVKLHSESMKAK